MDDGLVNAAGDEMQFSRDDSDGNQEELDLYEEAAQRLEEEDLNRAILMSLRSSAETTIPIVTPAQSNVMILVNMGFDQQLAEDALRDCDNNVEAAANMLISRLL